MGYLLDYRGNTNTSTPSSGVDTSQAGSSVTGGYLTQYLQQQKNNPVIPAPKPVSASGIPLDTKNPFASVSQVATTLSAYKPPEKNVFQKIGDFAKNLFGIKENDYTRDNQVVQDINAGAIIKNVYPEMMKKKIQETADAYKTTYDQAEQLIERQAEVQKKSVYDIVGLDVNKLSERSVGNPFRNTLTEEITKELGVRNTPTNKDIVDTFMQIGIGLGLVEAPVATALGLGTFEGINAVKAGLISTIKGEGFNPQSGYMLGDLAGEHKNLQTLLDTIDFVASGALVGGLLHGLDVSVKNVMKEKAAKSVLEKYNFPKTVEINPETFDKAVSEKAVYKEQMLRDLKIKPEDFQKAVTEGKNLEISAESLVKAANESYWKDLKTALEEGGKKPKIEIKVEEPQSATSVKAPSAPETATQQVENKTQAAPVTEKTAQVTGKMQEVVTEQKPAQPEKLKSEGMTATQIRDALITERKQAESVLKKISGMAKDMSESERMKLTKEYEPLVERVKALRQVNEQSLDENFTKKGHFGYELYNNLPTTEEILAKISPDQPTAIKSVLEKRMAEIKAKQENLKNQNAVPTDVLELKKGDTTPGSELPAGQKPVGEGEVRQSEAYRKVRDRLDEATRQDVNYNRLNLAADAEKAMDFVAKEPERALRVAFGLEEPPAGQTETAISIALADKAGREGKFWLQSQLESSRSLRQTRRGQEIVSERGRFNDDSPHRYIADLLDRRLKNIGKNLKSEVVDMAAKVSEAKKKAMEKIDRKAEEISKLVRRETTKKQLAQSILDQLTCK